MTRRDKCHLVGKRAARLSLKEGEFAWFNLAARLEGLGSVERAGLPKFNDLLREIRRATVSAKQLMKEAA